MENDDVGRDLMAFVQILEAIPVALVGMDSIANG
jgi:hypothetical protein